MREIEKGGEGGEGRERERKIENRVRKGRGEKVVGERENKRLHKDRSWRVPGASLHTMHLC